MQTSFFSRGLLLTLALLILVPLPLQAADKDFVGETVTWRITNSQIVAFGETEETKQGTLTTTYVVEAGATSDNAPITEALFRATVSAFSPKEKMPGQKPGVWYVKAKWEIMDKNATKEKLKEKHNESLMKGYLTAETDFNPATDVGRVIALAEFPLTLVGKYWGEAKGGFYGNELFEGDLDLTFDRWQKVKK